MKQVPRLPLYPQLEATERSAVGVRFTRGNRGTLKVNTSLTVLPFVHLKNRCNIAHT